MKRFLKYSAWVLVTISTLALGAWFWAHYVATSRYGTQWTVHKDDFPIPFPVSEETLAGLQADAIAGGTAMDDPLARVDLGALALERAVENGKHLVQSRTACNGCHGNDLGGAYVIDVPLVARWAAPNLTTGEGSVTRGFTANDWDRAVRHAVRRNGHSSSMPSQDYVTLSDHELSDIVAYIRSLPAVNRDMGAVKFGPVFDFVIATDPTVLAAFTIDHNKPHVKEPPDAASGVELGNHIVQVCRGCHGPTLSGGKLAGDPNMPIVANLTPHETGLKTWTEADFTRALREGVRKDGTTISEMMPWRAYGQMTDAEISAMWAYLQTVPAVASGNH
jgi:mono/diheme cytochrome c family protein